MHKEVEDYIKLQRKLFVLKYALLMKTNQEVYLTYEVPGFHIQVDVKFLNLTDQHGVQIPHF